MAVVGNQVKRKELTKKFQIEKSFGLHGLYKNISVLQGLNYQIILQWRE